MRVAIVGAGLSGLAVASYLLQQKASLEITLFDPNGIGGGASKIASLLHPYPGKKGRRSLQADIALYRAQELFQLASSFPPPIFSQQGILSFTPTREKQFFFEQLAKEKKDITLFTSSSTRPVFLISSGYTVDTTIYLQSLFNFCQSRGAFLIREKITTIQDLQKFDHIVLAAGAGIQDFIESKYLPIKFTKGQVLFSVMQENTLSLSCISRGYIAKSPGSQNVYLGSTYEHDFPHNHFCLATAKKQILPQLALDLPWVEKLPISSGQAALRVVNKNHYFPIIIKINTKTWIITAMGSRGLLYHAMFGYEIAKNILQEGYA